MLFQANPVCPGPETHLRVGQVKNFITFESVREQHCHVGILSNGQVKSALATGNEIDAQFGVRLIVSCFLI